MCLFSLWTIKWNLKTPLTSSAGLHASDTPAFSRGPWVNRHTSTWTHLYTSLNHLQYVRPGFGVSDVGISLAVTDEMTSHVRCKIRKLDDPRLSSWLRLFAFSVIRKPVQFKSVIILVFHDFRGQDLCPEVSWLTFLTLCLCLHIGEKKISAYSHMISLFARHD